MSWHRIKLSLEDVEASREMQIQQSFASLFLRHGRPRDAALFSSEFDDEGFSYLYFSPASMAFAGELVAVHGGEECPIPNPADIGLLAGSQSAWDLLSSDPIRRGEL